ncbi:MAG: hypothetical protein H6510_00995 [Acidobacteria bacterium]|nr:hypothetical protein [Acidobacteriota bacterium]MCB9396365.1 hypothetical protein [Acidobacteriota bacterium]
MWRILILCCAFSVFAQEAPALDPEMQKLMEKVEGKETKQVEIDFQKYQADSDAKKAALTNAFSYWDNCQKGDWAAVYELFWSGFREATPMESYLSQEKSKITNYEVASLEMLSDECAVITAYYGVQNPMMDLKKIRSKQSWHLENGSWKLVADPYANPMGITPPGTKKFENPCKTESGKISSNKM